MKISSKNNIQWEQWKGNTTPTICILLHKLHVKTIKEFNHPVYLYILNFTPKS